MRAFLCYCSAMKLYAVSDVHVGHAANLAVLESISPHPDDWLIIAGDVGESLLHLNRVLECMTERFARVVWVPGNHELWTMPMESARGEEKYRLLVECCRRFGVLTPEDPYCLWEGEGGPVRLCPLFLGYDYSFRPASVAPGHELEWAADSGILCADERFLHPDPYASKAEWCRVRCELTEQRLEAIGDDYPTVLINHYPLRRDLVHLFLIPRFIIWCGTTRTEDWHKRFRAKLVVSGHLHVPATDWVDGVRFEEVSLGYPRQWRRRLKRPTQHLREVLPGPRPRFGRERTRYHWR